MVAATRMEPSLLIHINVCDTAVNSCDGKLDHIARKDRPGEAKNGGLVRDSVECISRSLGYATPLSTHDEGE